MCGSNLWHGQSELVYGITGLMPLDSGQVILNGKDITKESIRQKCIHGMAHIPEDRHKDGLVLDEHASGESCTSDLLYRPLSETWISEV